MSKLKLNITNRAQEDIVLITDYIAKDNKNAAKMMSEYFYKICFMLADFPHLGTVRTDFSYKDYRFYVIKNDILLHTELKMKIYLYQEYCLIIRIFAQYFRYIVRFPFPCIMFFKEYKNAV